MLSHLSVRQRVMFYVPITRSISLVEFQTELIKQQSINRSMDAYRYYVCYSKLRFCVEANRTTSCIVCVFIYLYIKTEVWNVIIKQLR